jgi:hypothetical protein
MRRRLLIERFPNHSPGRLPPSPAGAIDLKVQAIPFIDLS